MILLGNATVFFQRVSFSMVIVCMVNHTALDIKHDTLDPAQTATAYNHTGLDVVDVWQSGHSVGQSGHSVGQSEHNTGQSSEPQDRSSLNQSGRAGSDDMGGISVGNRSVYDVVESISGATGSEEVVEECDRSHSGADSSEEKEVGTKHT